MEQSWEQLYNEREELIHKLSYANELLQKYELQELINHLHEYGFCIKLHDSTVYLNNLDRKSNEYILLSKYAIVVKPLTIPISIQKSTINDTDIVVRYDDVNKMGRDFNITCLNPEYDITKYDKQFVIDRYRLKGDVVSEKSHIMYFDAFIFYLDNPKSTQDIIDDNTICFIHCNKCYTMQNVPKSILKFVSPINIQTNIGINAIYRYHNYTDIIIFIRKPLLGG